MATGHPVNRYVLPAKPNQRFNPAPVNILPSIKRPVIYQPIIRRPVATAAAAVPASTYLQYPNRYFVPQPIFYQKPIILPETYIEQPLESDYSPLLESEEYSPLPIENENSILIDSQIEPIQSESNAPESGDQPDAVIEEEEVIQDGSEGSPSASSVGDDLKESPLVDESRPPLTASNNLVKPRKKVTVRKRIIKTTKVIEKEKTTTLGRSRKQPTEQQQVQQATSINNEQLLRKEEKDALRPQQQTEQSSQAGNDSDSDGVSSSANINSDDRPSIESKTSLPPSLPLNLVSNDTIPAAIAVIPSQSI